MAADLPDLRIHINGQQHTFFLNQKMVSAFSGKLKEMIRRQKKTTQINDSLIFLNIDEFPGGPGGFELISRFCYNNSGIPITVSTVSLLHCGAIFLRMNKKASPCNLFQKTEAFLEGMFYWSWNDVVICLKSCEPFFLHADSAGIIEKLIFSLLAKIAQNTDINLMGCSSSSSSSSPENSRSSVNTSSVHFNSTTTTTSTSRAGRKNRAWWFDDLSTLPPKIIEKVIKCLRAYGSDNSSLILTKFLLHYLKTAAAAQSQRRGLHLDPASYSGLADTAVYGVILMGKTAFSCRVLFWVLRVVSGFGLSVCCRAGLERLIGSMLDQAKLDDLLVSGAQDGGAYDVNLVVRLLRVFVSSDGVSVQRIKKVGWLVDQYLGEISPDPNLTVSKFLAISQSLPDMARDSFDPVYRAVDIYLESHPSLSREERSRLCGCLNYEKLSLEACKYLAKNPRIPPRIAVDALSSQPAKEHYYKSSICQSPPAIITRSISNMSSNIVIASKGKCNNQMVVYSRGAAEAEAAEESSIEEENEMMRLNIQRMQGRVLELEKLCMEMKGQMSKLVRHPSIPNRPSPRLC
ncbi:hypothetical protein Nepgr_000731 [Nepenthes gracilis]|uniref:NPH3 domain-containing protein n=1 Tax=Nepenthes gracilis TaxID=150966 RepID=A0AAD3RVM9_NEPGR|nr:hypothetical protein Nepgr_000731 [Nepenthes gracilis]